MAPCEDALRSGQNSRRCDECQSDYFAEASRMASLCPECAHILYGYAPCEHRFVAQKCTRCGWDGSRSASIQKRLEDPPG